MNTYHKQNYQNNKESDNTMAENKNETKIIMLTIKEAAALVNGMTEYRVRQMCINDQIPHIMAGRKYLINKDIFLNYLRGKTS
mgnify:FL=1